jgi:predicted small secreted protein
MKKSLTFITALLALFLASGCETWKGAKEDTAKSAEWSKEKVNDGAKYVEEKTD